MDDRDPERRTRASYEQIADAFLERTRDPARGRPFLEAFARALPAGARVYDVGAGPGRDCAEHRRMGLRPIALDLSRAMLRVARDEFPAPRVQADMHALPLADGSGDGLWANASLLHVRRQRVDAVLAGFARVLRPGGVLHVSVKQGDFEGFDSSRYGEERPRWFTGWLPEALDERLARAGFAVSERWRWEGARDTWLVRHARKAAVS